MTSEHHFTLTESHLKLLRKFNVCWEGNAYFGAPAVDAKRPYGNGDLERDIAEILGWPLFEDADEQKHLSGVQRENALTLHKQTLVALEIVLQTGRFEPGVYKRPKYLGVWEKVS